MLLQEAATTPRLSPGFWAAKKQKRRLVDTTKRHHHHTTPRSMRQSQLPEQRRVTAHIMRHWLKQKAIKDRTPSSRCEQMLALHRAQVIDVSCCSSQAVRMETGQASTATAIGTSSTRTVITSTPARSTLAARRMPTRRSWMRCRRFVMTRACPRSATTYRRCTSPTARPVAATCSSRTPTLVAYDH